MMKQAEAQLEWKRDKETARKRDRKAERQAMREEGKISQRKTEKDKKKQIEQQRDILIIKIGRQDRLTHLKNRKTNRKTNRYGK